jgi:hypothetical protein
MRRACEILAVESLLVSDKVVADPFVYFPGEVSRCTSATAIAFWPSSKCAVRGWRKESKPPGLYRSASQSAAQLKRDRPDLAARLDAPMQTRITASNE